jgi:hypothetical protein
MWNDNYNVQETNTLEAIYSFTCFLYGVLTTAHNAYQPHVVVITLHYHNAYTAMPHLKCGKCMTLACEILKHTRRKQSWVTWSGLGTKGWGLGSQDADWKRTKAKRPSSTPAQSHILDTPTLTLSYIPVCAIVNHTTMCHLANTPY